MNRLGRLVTLVAIAGGWAGVGPAPAQTPDSAKAKAAPDSVNAKAAPADSATAAAQADPPKINISGYATASYSYSTRRTGDQIVGRLYDRFQDQIELNAGKVVLEKTVATDKLDAGARVDLLFGQNATLIKSAGLNLGDQADMTQAFATLNIPAGEGKYLQFKAGKVATL